VEDAELECGVEILEGEVDHPGGSLDEAVLPPGVGSRGDVARRDPAVVDRRRVLQDDERLVADDVVGDVANRPEGVVDLKPRAARAAEFGHPAEAFDAAEPNRRVAEVFVPGPGRIDVAKDRARAHDWNLLSVPTV